ncbi:MAG: hypothetical protein II126_02935 [Erysipelotrichaceae bacterium]|nr:hypothetical protein [Erysipelotrichaceae bacterium]
MKMRLARVLCLLLSMMMVLAVFAGCGDDDTPREWRNPRDASNTDDGGDDDEDDELNIVKSAASQIKYQKYDNGLVSLDIPSGWKVEVAPADYIHYSFKVYNPKDKDYMFLFGLKQEGFLKSETARKTFAKYYPDAMFSKLAPVNPQTTEAFYKVWDKNAKLSNKTELKTNYFPYFSKFKVIQKLGKSMLGGDILRASFQNSSGDKMQGLFTSTVVSSGKYMLNTDPFNLASKKVDVAPLNVYHIILMTAPDAEFNNWQGIMDHCISTIVFSKDFVNGFNSEEKQITSTIIANQRVYDSISDMIMDSWEKRNNAYDITSQKQSDATLGYERVYDTQTGDVYRAYNGFTDDYSGSRYQSVTDDMYTRPIEGYIQK